MLSAVLAATLCFGLTLSALPMDNGTMPYTTLSLPAPLNWKTKTDAGGGYVIETLYKPYNQYNASGWSRRMLAECESLAGGTCVGYSELTTGAYNTEQPYRIWWGIVYGEGVKLSLGDFRRDVSEDDQIQDTFALVTRDSATEATSSTAGSMSTSISSSPTPTPSVQTNLPSSSNPSRVTSVGATRVGSVSPTMTSAASSSTAADSTSPDPAASTGAADITKEVMFGPVGLALLVVAAM